MATRKEIRDALASLPPDDGATVYDAASGELVRCARRDPLPGGGYQCVILNPESLKTPGGHGSRINLRDNGL